MYYLIYLIFLCHVQTFFFINYWVKEERWKVWFTYKDYIFLAFEVENVREKTSVNANENNNNNENNYNNKIVINGDAECDRKKNF